MKLSIVFATSALVLVVARGLGAIDIVVDYALDASNENWFDPLSAEGQARRDAVSTAAEFLSTIITNDDWESLPILDETFSVSDIAASSIFDLDGNPLEGTAESDGDGYTYSRSSNNIHTSNRSSVSANEYIVYVGAFAFDAGSTANAKGGSDSTDRRNAAGHDGLEFNTWGGKIYFNTTKAWYAGSNPGVDPTDDYGVQDDNKQPDVDISTDNWDWSTSSDSWKGFHLKTIDTTANGKRDLYAIALHELMHALGASSSKFEDYVGVDTDGNFIGENLVEVYGGPAPGDGSHFATNTQSLVWDSGDIVSEVVLDPNSLSGVRKYFTDLDAALLRDLGYDVLEAFPISPTAGDYNGNGTVDAADYTLWRDNLGDDSSVLGGTGSGAATVVQADYDLWNLNFGSPTAGRSAAVPEPSSLRFAVMGLASLFTAWRGRFALAS